MGGRVFETGSADETRALAFALGRLLRGPAVVLLDGSLGAGKTTFAQGVAAALGVGGRVTSPSFNIVRVYRTASDRICFVHLDLYRLRSPAEASELAIDEMLDDGCVLAIEWADRAPPIESEIVVRVELLDCGGRRRIAICGEGPGSELVAAIDWPDWVAEP